MAEPEAAGVQAHAFRAHAETNLDRADVARPDDHVRERQHAVVVVLVLVHDARAEPDHARIGVDRIGWCQQLLLERGGGGDDLERRAGLVQILDGPVAAFLVADIPVRVGIEGRVAGEREDFAAGRIHHDRGTSLRAGLVDAGLQLALGDVLQVLVDGQLEVGARGRRPLDPAECVALGVGLNEHRARVSFDQIVIRRLDAREAGVVDADVAEQVRGQLLVGVEAPVFLHETDAFELQVGDAPRLVGRHLAAHVDERAAAADALRERLAIRRRAVAERAAERRGRPRRLRNLGRHRVDRIGVHAVGEHVAAAIADLAALAGRGDRAQLLALRARDEIGVVVDLQVDEPSLDRRRPDEQADGGDGDSTLQRRAPRVGGPAPSSVEGCLSHVIPSYRRATTDFGGGGVVTTRSITVASPAAGATMPRRRVARRSMRAGDRSVSISSRR